MQQYELVADSDDFALSVAEINDHLKTSFTSIEGEPLLAVFVKAVEQFGENFTKRSFLQKGFRLYRHNFSRNILLERSPLVQISSVQYLDENDALQTVDAANYYTSYSSFYSDLIFNEDFSFPSLSSRVQAVRVNFVAGYTDDEADIPRDLKAAMLNHLAKLWENRGDCSDCSSSTLDKYLPETSRLLYSMYEIKEICL